MIEYFEKNWWLWLLRGVVAILFGGLAFALPTFTLTAMVLLFSGFMFADGIFALLSLFARRTDERWSWSAFFEGIAGILTAVMVCLIPGLSVLLLLYCVAGWAVASGLFKIVEAIHCRKAGIIPGTWLLGLSGLASMALGITCAFFPALGFALLAAMVGGYAILFGVLMVMEGLRLKRFYRIFDVQKVHLKIQHPYYPA